MLIDLAAPPPPIPEQTAVQFTYRAGPDAGLELRLDGALLQPFTRPGEPIWRWDWQSGAAVGTRTLLLSAPSAGPVSIPLQVTPRKLDSERHQLLLQDLQTVSVALAARLTGATAGAGFGAAEPRSAAEEIAGLFGAPLDGLERAIRQIAALPRERLGSNTAPTDLGRARRLTPRDLAEAARGPLDAAPPGVAPDLQRAIRPAGGLLPRSAAAEHGQADLDSYEHRLAKRLLELLTLKANELGNQAGAAGATAAAAQCAAAARRIAALRALPFFAGVGTLSGYRGPTPLLQRDPAYRTVHRAWLALRQSTDLSVASPLFALPLAELPRLYEVWCALVVAQALAGCGAVTHHALLMPTSGGFALALPENTPLLTVTAADATLTLWYQPRYGPVPTGTVGTRTQRTQRAASLRLSPPLSPPLSPRFGSLDRHTRVPDLALEIRRAGQSPVLLILDAKYRLDVTGEVPEDALADAYSYLGAIGFDGARCVSAALLLYPGLGPASLYASGVGAVPLLPGDHSALAAIIARATEGTGP